eukprot:723019-Amphidinium_carterae.1
MKEFGPACWKNALAQSASQHFESRDAPPKQEKTAAPPAAMGAHACQVCVMRSLRWTEEVQHPEKGQMLLRCQTVRAEQKLQKH